MYGAVFDGRAVRDQTNLRQWRDKIGLEAHDLVRVHCDPGTPFKGDRVGFSSESINAIPNGLIAPLAEMNLPGQPAVPMSQPFALHVVIRGVIWMKDQHE